MVLPSEDSTNEQEDDKGEAGKADGAGGESERCGRGACEPTGSNGNTGLGARVVGWGDRDAWVDMGLRDLLRVIERTVLRFAKRGPTWTRIMWMQPLVTQL
jgi:hypothetical protein